MGGVLRVLRDCYLCTFGIERCAVRSGSFSAELDQCLGADVGTYLPGMEPRNLHWCSAGPWCTPGEAWGKSRDI